jgi:hypothetical protein
LENLYIKTSDFELDDIIEFCIEQNDLNDFDYDEIQIQKDIIRENYPHTNIFIINEMGQVVAIDDQDVRTKGGDIIWTIFDIDLLDIWETEYYDLKKYNHMVDYGYEVVEAGYNQDNGWVYLQAESITTHYRSYLFNLQNITNLAIYIRQRKIGSILS